MPAYALAPAAAPAPLAPGQPPAAADTSGVRVWLGGPLARVHRRRLGAWNDPDVASPDWDAANGRFTVRRARNESGALVSIYVENPGPAALSDVTVDVGHFTRVGGSEQLRMTPADLSGITQTGDARRREIGRRLHAWGPQRRGGVYKLHYLQVNCLSLFGGYGYDGSNGPNAAPLRFKATPNGQGYQPWNQRPDANTWYPEVCVPVELDPRATILPGSLQEWLVEGYVPKTQAPGTYEATVTVRRGAAVLATRTVRWVVRSHTLPDQGKRNTWLMHITSILGLRAALNQWPGTETAAYEMYKGLLKWCHRLGIQGWQDTAGTTLEWLKGPMLDGSLYTDAENYDGPQRGMGEIAYIDLFWWQGSGFPNNPIGANGDGWVPTAAEADRIRAYVVERYNQVKALNPNADLIPYLIDERSDTINAQLRVANVMRSAPGAAGQNVKPTSTLWMHEGVWDAAGGSDPNGGIRLFMFPPIHPAQGDGDVLGRMRAWVAAGKEVWYYNGGRPGTGTYHVETPCGDRLMKAPSVYLHGVHGDWHFESTRAGDDQNRPWFGVYDPQQNAETDLWASATNFQIPRPWNQTGFAGSGYPDGQVGLVHDNGRRAFDPGWSNTSNGDGLLVYPGFDGFAQASVRRPNTHRDFGAGTVFPSKRLFDMGRCAMLYRWIDLADAASPQATRAACVSVLPETVGPEMPPVPNAGNQNRLSMRDCGWAQYQPAYEAFVEQLVGVVDAGPPAGGAGTTVVLDAYRNDGQAGTAVARGPAIFLPGEVQPADLANLTAWDGATEVPIYVEDVGARHTTAGNNAAGPDNGVLYAQIEAERTWASANENRPLTLRFDRPVGAQSRRAKATYARAANTLEISVSTTDPTRFRVTNSGYYYRTDTDEVRRFAPQDVPWGAPPPGEDNNIWRPGSGVAMGAVVIAARADGTLVAYKASAKNMGSVTDEGPGTWNLPWNLDPALQTLAVLGVYVSAGAGSLTLGQINLTGDPAIVRVTTTGGATAPYVAVPRNVPPALLTTADVNRRVNSSFVPWDMEPAGVVAARGGIEAEVDAIVNLANGGPRIWARFGAEGDWATQGGRTTYANNVMHWQDYARTGQVRALRRALAMYATYRDMAEANRIQGGGQLWTGGEPFVDGAVVPFHAMLTNDPEANARATDMLYVAEQGQYNTYPDVLNAENSGRFGMRVKQAVLLLHRMGRRATNGLALSAWHEWNSQNTTAMGTLGIWRRAASHLRYATRAGTGPNASRRRWYFQAYGGMGPFMMGFDLSFAAACQRFIARIPTVDADIRDSYRYLFEAVNDDGTTLMMYDASQPGREAFRYDEGGARNNPYPAGNDDGPLLNGCHFLAMSYLIRTADTANATTWRARLRTVLRATRTAEPWLVWQGKRPPECGLFTPAALKTLDGSN